MITTLSLIVVAYNERPHIARLKRSIDRLHNVDDVQVEAILVDGGSRDGTPDVARQCSFDRVVERLGASIPVCRNVGLAESTGQWVAFVDADCELDSDWLANASALLRLPKPVVAGWPALPPAPGTWVQRAWHTHWMHKNRRFEGFHGFKVVRHDAFRLITTRNMALNREVSNALHGFDEQLPTGEDTDFVFRAYHAGFDVLACPELKVIHHGEPATLRQFYRQQTWHAQRSSYARVIRTGGFQRGANAPKFSAMFLACSCAFLVGIVALAFTHNWWASILLFPLPILVGLPACLMAVRAKKPSHVLPLCLLYLAYGVARSLDLLGFYRLKTSWKSPKPNGQTAAKLPS